MAFAEPPPPPAVSDGQLVASALAGEGAAFAAIMRRNNRRLYRLARSILRDDAEAEDAVQETYLRAFTRLDAFRGEASLATWLTRIIMNESLGRLRRRRPTAELECADQEAMSGSAAASSSTLPSPEGQAARAEIRRLVESAIDALPANFRTVFILRAVEQLSVEETAACLGILAETVKTRHHRAKRLLREALSRELGGMLEGAFPFAGARCDRINERVLARLGLAVAAPA